MLDFLMAAGYCILFIISILAFIANVLIYSYFGVKIYRYFKEKQNNNKE